jgi:hypothetical protein
MATREPPALVVTVSAVKRELGPSSWVRSVKARAPISVVH